MYLYPILKKDPQLDYSELINNFKETAILNKNNEEIGTALSIKDENDIIYLALGTKLSSLTVIINNNKVLSISHFKEDSKHLEEQIKDLESEVQHLSSQNSALRKEKIVEKFDIKNEDKFLLKNILEKLDESDTTLMSNFEEFVEKYALKEETEKNYKKIKNFI